MIPIYQGKQAVFDLDDCIGDMRTPLMGILNSASGKDLHWSSWASLNAEEVYDISSERFFELASRHELLEWMQPHVEACDVMETCRERGLHVVILTARGWHPRGRELTQEWLADNEIHYDELIVCDVQDDKADYIQDRDVLFTVDDSARHCNTYAERNSAEFVFAYDFPWTGSYLDPAHGIIRINSLWELGNHIEGL